MRGNLDDFTLGKFPGKEVARLQVLFRQAESGQHAPAIGEVEIDVVARYGEADAR
jgi:hypothetical protein